MKKNKVTSLKSTIPAASSRVLSRFLPSAPVVAVKEVALKLLALIPRGKPRGFSLRNYKYYQIAIDGPAGSGKSTIAKLIAKRQGYLYVDSGAMYRAVTLYLIKNKLLVESESRLKECLKKIKIEFKQKRGVQLIFLNDKDVTKQIRLNVVNKHVSEVSSKKVVRTEMVKRQKQFALSNSIVMDGRDIGTTVLKNANLKIYLTASSIVRAKRRKNDLTKLHENIKIKDLVKEIQARDNFDSSRRISPLSKGNDCIVIDSTALNINQVLEQIYYFLPIV